MERINATTGSYNFIDLFAGAGGLSEGFIQAGFSPVAHVEMNPYAAQTLETRTGYYYLKAQGKLDIYKDYISGKITRDEFLQHIPEEQLQSVFCETMSNETLPRLFENIDRILTQRGIKQVDVIIGGPPCQAYSLVGRAQSKHMETPMSADPRNDLYKLYARFLQKYHPKMFVFENVMGIKSANSGATWLKVQEALRSVGYEIECHEQNSKNFGVLQNRRRMIIVGWLKNTGLSYPQFEQTIADATVNDILSDLPALQPGGKSGEYRSDDFSDYLRSTGIRKDSDILTHHCARPNKDRDIEIYRRTIELWNDGHKRLNYNDLPDELKTHKNRKSFLDRFKVVEGDEAYCHTMLAHISKDGHYFIHPDIEQHRSITVREAARIQSFPDDYFFEGPRTAQFVQIGNGVLFLGAFMDNTKLLFPVLLLCDENGEYINFTEDEIVSALEEANDSDVRYFKPTDEEQSYFHRIYARLISEVQDQHDKTVAPTIAYNKKKIENWVDVQQEQLHVQLTDAQKEVEEYILAEMQATDTLEKKDIRKKAAEAKKKMDKLQHDLPKRRKEIQDEAQAEIDRFNQLQEINPLLLINIVLKF